MSNYIFLTSNNTEGETTYFAIPSDKIETLRVQDTYDRYGQSISPEDAGDGLTLLSAKAVELANKFYHDNHADYDDLEILQKFSINDYVSAYEYKEYSEIVSTSELKEDEDYSVQCTECKGFNYWDGSNWKTVLVEHDTDECKYSVVDDEELTRKLNEAIEAKEFVKDGFGRKIYETEDYEIEYNYCQGTWAAYCITMK